MDGMRKFYIALAAIICSTVFMVFALIFHKELAASLAQFYLGEIIGSVLVFAGANIVEHKIGSK